MNLPKLSKANVKLRKLEKKIGGKIYTFSLIAGVCCPFAEICLSKVVKVNGKSKIKDGPKMKFRCYAASAEVMYPAVLKQHEDNFKYLKVALKNGTFVDDMVGELSKIKKIKGFRYHSGGGDFYSLDYFKAAIELANRMPEVTFYAYTKALPFYVKMLGEIPANFKVTASFGGTHDELIKEFKLKHVVVVKSLEEADEMNLPVDHDDELALNYDGNFALLVHNSQPANSEYGKAMHKMRREGVNGYR